MNLIEYHRNILIYAFIFSFLFILIQIEETTEHKTYSDISYPSILTLLNKDLIMVASDGIHYINNDLTEDSTKFISFDNPINSYEMSQKTTMAQFSEENEGFIIILVNHTLYFLESDGTRKSNIDLPDAIDSIHYCIIPYKKERFYLYYIIAYPVDKTFHFYYFQFEIRSPNSNSILIKKENIETKSVFHNSSPEKFEGVTCLFMINSSLNREILVCFYHVYHPAEIQARCFDPLNNFDELSDLFRYYIHDPSLECFYSIISMTNNEKNIAYIYYTNGYPYMITFDFFNGFSNGTKIIMLDYGNLFKHYSKHKMLYIGETNEFIIGSGSYTTDSSIYLLFFDSNFNFKNFTVFNRDTICSESESFSLFYCQNNYNIVFDDFSNKKISFKTLLNVELNIGIANKTTENNDNILENKYNNSKCKEYTTQSKKYDLCTKCNNEEGYYPVEDPNNSLFHGLEGFVECYNEETKESNFYLDKTDLSSFKYKPCYESCATCEEGGDEFNNNCIECAKNHIKKPNELNTKMCVTKCKYRYYITFYEQYKCTFNNNCPDEANLYIKDLGKCIDDCNNDEEYKFQYAGQCFKECPEQTHTLSESNNICYDDNADSCTLSEEKIEAREYMASEGIDVNVKNYVEEFGYNDKHVSRFFNDIYSILFYKDEECIEKLEINMPKVDFGECKQKVLDSLGFKDKKLIIALVEKLNEDKNLVTSYSFYHPDNGDKIEAETICKDDFITVNKSVLSMLNNSNTIDINSILYLTQQNIDIFNLSSAFYTDICFHYNSPNGKDVPLQDRVKAFYPNITLCEAGCTNKGVNLTTMESICQCKFMDIMNNELLEENVVLKNTLGQVTDLLKNSNLDVLKCYKDVFNPKYIIKSEGGFIILSIIFLEIILTIIFYLYNYNNITSYLFNLTEYYSSVIRSKKDNNNLIDNKDNARCPPSKKKGIGKTKKSKIKFKDFNNSQKEIKPFKKTGIDSNKSNSNSSINKSDKMFESCNNILKHNSKNNYKFFGNDQKKEKTEEVLSFSKKLQQNYGINADEYLKTNPDEMEFDDAMKYDKRAFFECFCDRFKEKQIMVDTFYNKESLKPMTIKVILLLLNIDLYFVVNGLFFSEDYISELFHSDEEEKFFSFFSRSIDRFFYATLVGTFIGIIMDCIFVEEKKVKRVFIREQNDVLQLKYQISLIIKNIKLNYLIFIILCFIISIFSWYYINCFNNCYPGVKAEWNKSSITIILLMQLLTILMAFLEAILRLISFKCKSEKIYKLKEIIN